MTYNVFSGMLNPTQSASDWVNVWWKVVPSCRSSNTKHLFTELECRYWDEQIVLIGWQQILVSSSVNILCRGYLIIRSGSGFTMNSKPKWIQLTFDTPKVIRFAKWIWTRCFYHLYVLVAFHLICPMHAVAKLVLLFSVRDVCFCVVWNLEIVRIFLYDYYGRPM